MKKLFIILFGLIIVTVMVGCFNLTAVPPFLDSALVIISEPIITATEDQLYSYQVEAKDLNGDDLKYSLIIKPVGMNINSENGLIIWTPTNNQVGIHQVEVEISDGKHSITQSFEIEVFNVNNPPQIFSYFPANLNFEINEGNSIKFEVQANDIDLNATLSFQWFLNGKLVSDSTGSGNDSKSSWIYSAGYGDYSQKIVKALVSDGELQDYVQWNITINDITPPAQPILNTVTSPTNIPTQTLSGNKESNTSIWVNGAEVISINSNTTWSHPYSLSEGTNNISITSRDAAGNESSAVTAIIILDTISPAVPTLDAVVSPTNISPQTLSGTKEADTSILINGVEVIPINSETTWAYSLHLTEGTNSIFITSCDAAGNESSSVSTTIVLDISTPEIPTLNDVISPTNISPQILSGTKEANTSIWINGREVTPFDSSTNWSYPYNLSEGTNNISITSRDAAGNESSAVTAIIILDTISPAVPTLDAVVSPTNISPQTLSGTKETDTSVWINNIEIVPINSSTNWIYDFNLSEGENNISINSRDAVGNESAVVNNSITLDTIPPTTPTLHNIISPTNICIQLLSGNKEINSSIWVNGVEVISVNSETTWSYDFELIEGENSISIISKDIVGNESNEINTTVILDISAPATPSLGPIISPTNISSQTLSGTKEANTSIWVNGAEVISINSDTTWSYPYNLSEGTNNISITSRDATGNESSTVTAIIEYDPNIYVDAANVSGIEDGTKTHPFDTISEGIEAVISGKSVVVAVGTYYEQLIINKGIDLWGAGKESTFILGLGYTGNLITVTADDVTISGFTIDGKSATNMGIYSDSSSSIEISENIIQNHQDSGILYHRTTNDYPSGIYVYNNEICFNSTNGIKVIGAGSGIIEGNIIRKNYYGISAYNDTSLEVKKNNIHNNYDSGIFCRNNSSLLIWSNKITSNGYGIRVGEQYSDTTNPDIGGGARGGIGKNNLVGNTTPKGVSNMTDHNIYAKYNWWGDAAGPKYPNNPDGNANLSSDWAYWDNVNNKTGAIIFEDYLTEPQIF